VTGLADQANPKSVGTAAIMETALILGLLEVLVKMHLFHGASDRFEIYRDIESKIPRCKKVPITVHVGSRNDLDCIKLYSTKE